MESDINFNSSKFREFVLKSILFDLSTILFDLSTSSFPEYVKPLKNDVTSPQLLIFPSLSHTISSFFSSSSSILHKSLYPFRNLPSFSSSLTRISFTGSYSTFSRSISLYLLIERS